MSWQIGNYSTGGAGSPGPGTFLSRAFSRSAIWDTGLTCGNVSLIAQSGMLAGAFLIDLMSHGTMGISKVCSIGNKMDLDENDLLAYLIDDPKIAAIGLYLESFTYCRRFMALSRRTAKPIVVLNGGKTAGGAAAAVSHTASLSASVVLASGAMAQAGNVKASGFYQLTDYCKILGMYPEIPAKEGNRVAVLTYTGAAGIVSADSMDRHNLELSELSTAALDALHMIDRLKCRNMLDGYRGIDPVDKSALGSILVTLGDLGCAYPAIQEIDINPLIIHKGGPIAVDGLVVPAHMVESE